MKSRGSAPAQARLWTESAALLELPRSSWTGQASSGVQVWKDPWEPWHSGVRFRFARRLLHIAVSKGSLRTRGDGR